MKLRTLLGVFFILKCALSANILGVFSIDWGSHYILGTKLMRGLAEAGHNVTVISPRKYTEVPKNGNWTDIVLDGFGKEFKNMLGGANFFGDNKKNDAQPMKKYADMLFVVSNQTLRYSKIQQLFNSNATFDAVIIDQVMNDCHLIFAYHFKCPSIILSSIGANVLVNTKVGNPSPVPTIPDTKLDADQSREMTFVERVKDILTGISMYLFMTLIMFPKHDKILRESYPEAPNIYDLCYNVSFILLNSHTSLTKAVPLVPNMMEIGGYHIDPPQKLPMDLQDFLDSAKDGAIYFSMGSSLNSKDMSEEKKKILLNVFKNLKQKILWKFEDDLPAKPNNVLIKNWMPQNDILAHPNTKLFITHGGLLSATETIYHGVPVLTIPVFGDQETNAQKAVEMGIGLKISYRDDNFNEETLQNLIQKILNNPKYRENTQIRSKIYHDRPMTPMQSAVYWVEYVIRHKGAPHLRVAGIGMSWYKYYMVDVIVVLLGGLLTSILVLSYFLRKLVRVLFSKRTKPDKVKRA